MLDNEAKDGLELSGHKTPDEIPSEDDSVTLHENDSVNMPESVQHDSTPNVVESVRRLSSSPDPLLWLEELELKVDCDLQSLIYNNEAGIPYRIPFIDAAVLKKVFSQEFQNDLDDFLSNGEDSLHIATAHLIHCASGEREL